MRKLFLILLLLAPWMARAEMVDIQDPAFEARFKALTEELRCQKCQNQSVYDSKAGLADDMKRIVRTQMHEGKTDEEIVEYLVARYGDFIRYRPDFNAANVLLWVGPFVLMLVGATVLISQVKKRRRLIVDAPLSADESNEVQSIIKNRGDK